MIRVGLISITFICLSAQRLHPNHREAVIIWHVGQGQWVSWIKTTTCFHYDVGGERGPFALVKKLCQMRQNPITISHWDYDHLNLVNPFKRTVYNHCYTRIPLGETSPSKKRIFSTWTLCGRSSMRSLDLLFPRSGDPLSKTSNGLSSVALIQKKILVAGDSTRAEEKIWARRLEHQPVTDLILGHHGSLTSTSNFLIQNLPHLKRAYASARQQRYGHPHAKVVQKLKAHGVSVIKTEDWGNIILPLSASEKN